MGMPVLEFRRCLASARVDDGVQATVGDPDEEDRTILLAEKNAAGAIRWKSFAKTYLGWQDDEYRSDPGDLPSPKSPKKHNMVSTATQQTFHQTWRSGKTVPERNVVYSPEKAQNMTTFVDKTPTKKSEVPTQ